MRTRLLQAAALTGAACCLAVSTTSAPAVGAVSHQRIEGSGSSWAANAVNQWIADVYSSGLQVVFSPVGSAQGRKDFAFKTNDFAVSDIGFQGQDPVTGDNDTSQGREYAYLPIVAGGTAFPYQIKVGGKLVQNLRLSGTTLAEIFTNQITNWSDKRITADNNGHALPSIPIIPVVHSEGSGSTAQFTTYLDTEYPSIWRPYYGRSGFTEYYPRRGSQIAQNGSDGVMNYISSKSGNGSIGFDEYSYALNKSVPGSSNGFPVAKILNSAGYYNLPTQYNVAVALTKAIINNDKSSPNYLLQDLHNVYVYNDKRVYPLSSYSYMIEPTGPDCGSNNPPGCDSKMSTGKRQTLADYLYWSLCQGQKEMGKVGYSPLPVNLVQASFDQVGKLKQADPNVDLTSRNVSTCDNPTFISGQPTRNYLAEIAPQPPLCDKQGQGPCTGAGDTGTANPPGHGTSGHSGSQSSGPGGAGTGTTSSAAHPGSTTGSPGATAAPGAIDPATGQVIGASGGADGSGGDAVGVPTTLAAGDNNSMTKTLAPLAAVLLLVALVLPPIMSARTRRRGGTAE
jgi:phosphate transport system substrate-binding protein